MGAGLLVYDVLFLTLAALVYGGSAWAAARTFRVASLHLPWELCLVPSSLAFTLAVIAQVGLLSALCPRLVPGRYPMMKSPVFWGWLFRSMLRRLLLLPGLKWLVMTSNVLRFFALRALGADVAFSASMSSDVDVLDPQLLRVSKGAMLGARSILTGHYVEQGTLVLGAISVGEGALLAADVMCGPEVTIGAGARIGARTSLSVGVVVGEDARVAADVFLDMGAKVGKGARVSTRAFLPRGADVADGARFPAQVDGSVAPHDADAKSASSASKTSAPAV